MYQDKYMMYLEALKHPFQKLSRLEFLNPDDSVAFALDNNYNRGYRSRYDSRAFIQSGNLNVSLQNGQRRKANISLANIDDAFEYSVNHIWFGSRVRLSMGLVLPDGTDFYLPQGVFYFKDPQAIRTPTQKEISYSLVDKWSYLDGGLFGVLPYTYEVAIGTNIFVAMQKVLNLDRRNIKSLATANEWKIDPTPPVFTDYYNNLPDVQYEVEDANGNLTVKSAKANETAFTTTVSMGSKASDILLDLNRNIVGWIGYDQTGALRVDPSQDDIVDADKPILWTFSPANSQLASSNDTVKNSDVFNDVIVIGESATGGAVYGRATNYDPISDTNVNLIGLKTHTENRAEYWNSKQCVDYADWLLKRKTVLQKSVSISSSQIFHLVENRLIAVVRSDKKGSPVERHVIQSFSLPIGETGNMTINAVSTNDFSIATKVTSEIDE